MASTLQATLNSVDRLVGEDPKCHPGLKLDKLSKVPERQADAKEPLRSITGVRGEPETLKPLLVRYRKTLEVLGAKTWERKTTGPLAMHLARAGIFENAGICLHRTYGFAYIPGSGLKGMARAWAETGWMSRQADKLAAQAKIDEVFGWGDTKERREAILRGDITGDTAEIKDQSGAVVFHDAWPTSWPELVADILTCHHSKYYQSNGEADPPGDWESPNMVSFLSAAAGTPFLFALSPRDAGKKEFFDLAQQWLDDALTYLGAGSKTNSGYGAFASTKADALSRIASDRHLAMQCELKLLSPGWFAGPHQEKPDCDLRTATVRGHLRWWWRTMHSAHLKVSDLRKLETAIWGSSEHGGAVRIVLERDQSNPDPIPSPLKDNGQKTNEAFYRKHQMQVLDGQRTPGLAYAAYGMHEKNRRRHCIEPGATWTIGLVCRASTMHCGTKDKRPLTMQQVMEQACAALWLWVHHGGSGSKARNGFGSFTTPGELGGYTLAKCREQAASLRKALQLNGASVQPDSHETPSINAMLDVIEIPTKWQDGWHAVHQIGNAMQAVASSLKHREEKRGLGLPRKIHGPRDRALPGQNAANRKPPMELKSIKVQRSSDRHPAALFYSLDQGTDGKLLVRITAMPDKYLCESQPDYNAHKAFLQRVLPEIEKHLRQSAGVQVAAVQPASPPRPQPKDIVGGDRLKLDWKPESFNRGQKNCNPAKVGEFLTALKALEDDSDFPSLVSFYHAGLQLSNKDRCKRLLREPSLQPLVEYLIAKKGSA